MTIQKFGESLDWIPAIPCCGFSLRHEHAVRVLIIGGRTMSHRLLPLSRSQSGLRVNPASLHGNARRKPYKAVEVTPDIGATRAGRPCSLLADACVCHLVLDRRAVLLICLCPAQLELNLLLSGCVCVLRLFLFRGYRFRFSFPRPEPASRLWCWGAIR
jgi:hypothetical protein